ncbi:MULTISPECIES: hypothetical protein [unclassified Streptomyces]|uniref:hypothetical protein n=1 Tax=unclassified Streptomyces TaxID=2593676 RepID=UPI001903E61A|nr:hypothetical protein [Streptomyces sp. HSG2]
MSDITGRPELRAAAIAVVHESYSFACMRCGHGWEQSYDIEHHTDVEGREFVRYLTGGAIVPSPLSRPACRRCEGHVVRIMRPGRVAGARRAGHRVARVPAQAEPRRNRRLPGLLHALHLRRG